MIAVVCSIIFFLHPAPFLQTLSDPLFISLLFSPNKKNSSPNKGGKTIVSLIFFGKKTPQQRTWQGKMHDWKKKGIVTEKKDWLLLGNEKEQDLMKRSKECALGGDLQWNARANGCSFVYAKNNTHTHRDNNINMWINKGLLWKRKKQSFCRPDFPQDVDGGGKVHTASSILTRQTLCFSTRQSNPPPHPNRHRRRSRWGTAACDWQRTRHPPSSRDWTSTAAFGTANPANLTRIARDRSAKNGCMCFVCVLGRMSGNVCCVGGKKHRIKKDGVSWGHGWLTLSVGKSSIDGETGCRRVSRVSSTNDLKSALCRSGVFLEMRWSSRGQFWNRDKTWLHGKKRRREGERKQLCVIEGCIFRPLTSVGLSCTCAHRRANNSARGVEWTSPVRDDSTVAPSPPYGESVCVE